MPNFAFRFRKQFVNNRRKSFADLPLFDRYLTYVERSDFRGHILQRRETAVADHRQETSISKPTRPSTPVHRFITGV